DRDGNKALACLEIRRDVEEVPVAAARGDDELLVGRIGVEELDGQVGDCRIGMSRPEGNLGDRARQDRGKVLTEVNIADIRRTERAGMRARGCHMPVLAPIATVLEPG